MESGGVKIVRRNGCAIISCMKSKNDGVRLYKYPRKKPLLRWWAENCRHNSYHAARYKFLKFLICSDHFEEDCFGTNQRLRRGSIPTLNLGYDDPEEIAKLNKSKFEKSSAMLSSATTAAAMPLHCCVPNCGRTKQDHGVNLYKFPDESEILANWSKNLHLELDRVECKKLLICNMHFEARCISPRGIFKRAVPTLLLGHSNIEGVDLIENPESFISNYLQCCVPHCGSSKIEEGVILHSFPKIRSLFEKWARNLNLPRSKDLWHKKKVCNKHFEVYCYVYKRLKAGSLPTLNLGHDNISNIFTINEGELNNKPKRKNGSNANNRTSQPPLPTCSYPDCKEIEKGRMREVHSLPKLPIALHNAWLEKLNAALQVKNIIIEDEGEASDPKLCPVHFKLFFDDHLKLFNELKSPHHNLTPEEQQSIEELEEINCRSNAFPTVSDASSHLYGFPINRDLSAIDRVSETDEKMNEDDEDDASMNSFLQSYLDENTGGDGGGREDLSDIQDMKPNKDEPDIKLGLDYNNCHVPDCTTTLHTLPVEADLYAKWTNNCQLDANSERRQYFRVCNRHFERKLYVNNCQLIYGAVPTLELGSNPPSTIYDNRELLCNQEREGANS